MLTHRGDVNPSPLLKENIKLGGIHVWAIDI